MGSAIVPLEGAYAPAEARQWEGQVFRQVLYFGGTPSLIMKGPTLAVQRPRTQSHHTGYRD